MKKLLHIIATPRDEESRTLQVSRAFLECFEDKHSDWEVETLNLFNEKLPELTVKRLDGKYHLLEGKDLTDELKEAWSELVSYIEQFLSADGYLISCPMWNFGIPYILKQYIDIIVQPKYLFRYTQNGPEGLIKNKKMLIITSRGGDYSSEQTKPYDLQEPYLRTVFNFVGITEIQFINTQPMDAMGSDVQKTKIETAKIEAQKRASQF